MPDSEFGWSDDAHRERDDLLGQLKFPRSLTLDDGATVSADKLRFLLHRLNYHGGWQWSAPGINRLSDEMGCDAKTVKRAVKALESLGLIRTQRRKDTETGLTRKHYQVCWEEVRRRGRYDGHPEHRQAPRAAPPAAASADQRDILTPVTVSHRSGPIGHPDPSVGDQRDILTHRSADQRDILTHRPGAKGHSVHHDHDHEYENHDHDACADEGNDHDRQPLMLVRKGSGNLGGWDVPITVEGLRDPAWVEARYRHALAAGWLPETDRSRLLVHAAAVQAPRGRTPGALFTRLVRQPQQGGINESAEDQARARIADLDAGRVSATPARRRPNLPQTPCPACGERPPHYPHPSGWQCMACRHVFTPLEAVQ